MAVDQRLSSRKVRPQREEQRLDPADIREEDVHKYPYVFKDHAPTRRRGAPGRPREFHVSLKALQLGLYDDFDGVVVDRRTGKQMTINEVLKQLSES